MKRICALLVAAMFLFTGCWDKVEIEDRDYAITLGLDKGPDGYGYTLTLCMGALGGEETDLAEGLYGLTLSEAMEAMNQRSSNAAYYGMVKAVVLGEKLMEDGELLLSALTELEGDREVNDRLLLIAAKGDAAEIVTAIPDTGTPYGLYLSEYYKNHKDTRSVNLEDALLYLGEGMDVSLPVVQLGESGLFFDGEALLTEGTLVGYFSKGNRTKGSLV